jgi:hypothetical protein
VGNSESDGRRLRTRRLLRATDYVSKWLQDLLQTRTPAGYAWNYLSISEAQFKMMDKGAALGSFTLALTRNFWPSALTS